MHPFRAALSEPRRARPPPRSCGAYCVWWRTRLGAITNLTRTSPGWLPSNVSEPVYFLARRSMWASASSWVPVAVPRISTYS